MRHLSEQHVLWIESVPLVLNGTSQENKKDKKLSPLASNMQHARNARNAILIETMQMHKLCEFCSTRMADERNRPDNCSRQAEKVWRHPVHSKPLS